MEQHPIPTNVSSYQFKLVGDMTLKQFFQVAGGVLFGIIFYSTPLLPIIKWPLAGISVLLGVGLAFLPFEERPLERWIVAFFRAIYSPTIFKWEKSVVVNKIFQDEAPESTATQTDAALKDYLSRTGVTPVSHANLDKAEGSFLKNLTGLFNTPAQTTTTTPVIPSTPVIANVAPPVPQIQINPPVVNQPETQPTQVAPKVMAIPESKPIQVQPTGHQTTVQVAGPLNPAVISAVTPVMAGTNIVSTTQAMFSADAAPPSPPTYPNVVVGQIIDQDRHVVEGVILEIKDSDGRPIRAIRSNKVGHFITVTQLDNGRYDIVFEKDGYEFTPVSFDATGTLIQPILIRARRLSPLLAMPEVPVKPAYSIN